MRAMTSAKFSPAALTSMATSSGPGRGSGRSSTRRTSGPPCLVMTTARTSRTLPADVHADDPGHAGQRPRRGAGPLAGLLGALLALDPGPDERAADPAQGLGRDPQGWRVDDGQAGELVAGAGGQAAQDPATEMGGPDAVAGEAEHGPGPPAGQRDHRGQMRRRGVDRPAPGVLEAPAGHAREEPHEVARDLAGHDRIDLGR